MQRREGTRTQEKGEVSEDSRSTTNRVREQELRAWAFQRWASVELKKSNLTRVARCRVELYNARSFGLQPHAVDATHRHKELGTLGERDRSQHRLRVGAKLTMPGLKRIKARAWVLACVMATLPMMSVVFTLPITLVMLRVSDAFVCAVISRSSLNMLTWSLVCRLSVRLSMPLSASLHVIAT